MTIIDYTAFTPREELNMAFQRVRTTRDLNSLECRAVCLIQIGSHGVGIVLKPLYYLAIGLLMKLSINFFAHIPENVAKDEAYETTGYDLTAYKNNPELQEQSQVRANGVIITSIAAPLSQIVQLFKAIMGLVYPGAYFVSDELAGPLKELAQTAVQVGATPALVEKLNSETIHKSLNEFPNREFFLAQYKQDFTFITEQFRDPKFPKERKLALLTMLSPEPEGSGIEACPGGLGRILQQICAQIAIPEDPLKVIPWLTSQYKEELITEMVMRANATRGKEIRPEWHTIIHKLSLDFAHRGNSLTVAIGKRVALSSESIEWAEQDPLAHVHLTEEKLQTLEKAFRAFYTKEDLTAYLKTKINAQPDGSPGLKNLRNHIIQALSETLVDEEDPATEAVRLYTVGKGIGDPRDEGFNNLTEEAIQAFSEKI